MNKDEAAFPTQMWDNELKEATWLDGGLTKREFFAAMAMQGLLSAVYSSKEMLNDFTKQRSNGMPDTHLTGCEAITKNALSYADALLEALEEKKPQDPNTSESDTHREY